MPTIRFDQKQLQGRRIFLLVEINFGSFGRFRISTEPIVVPGTNGGLFDSGLDGLTFLDEVDYVSTSETNKSASIQATLGVDVSKLVAQGFDISQATASLSQWVEGTNYEDRRRVFVDTRVNSPQYGELYDQLRFTIRANLYDNVGTFPPSDAIINGATWPDTTLDMRGIVYPWIFGTPGKFTDTSISGFIEQYRYSVPVYPIIDNTLPTFDEENFLIAGHPMAPNTQVDIIKKSDTGTIQSGTVFHHNDKTGRTVALVKHTGVFGSPSDFKELANTEMVAKIKSGGGILNETNSAPRRGMGEIIEYLLNYAPNLSVDRARTRTASVQLNRYKMDPFITEPVEIWRFLRSNVLSYGPVSLVHGPDGMYPIVWDKDKTPSDCIANVDASRDQWERTSPVTAEFLEGEPQNCFTMAFRIDGVNDEPRKRIVVDGARTDSNAYAIISNKRYGKRERAEDEAISFYENTDVENVLAWWSRLYGFPIKSIEYTAPIHWGWIEAGSHIVFTDDKLNIENQIVIVQAVEWSEEQIIGIRLVWLEDLPRDDRLT